MKIGSINSYQTFRGNNDGKSLIEQVSSAIGTTSKATEDLSDIVISTKNALSSPEEATIGILTNQIEDKVVNNEKAPSWLRKGATYGAAALAAGGAFIGARKAPGFLKNFIVKNLSKTKVGTKILDKLVGFKQSCGKLLNSCGKENVKNAISRFGKYISEKFPKTVNAVKKLSEKVKLDKLTKLSAADYLKNIFAVFVGYQTGKKILNKHQDKVNSDKPAEVDKTEFDDETDYEEAA
ncbi:hypothetical protein IJS77_04290 [bacterium]|nr:hypothetical protein [bacterium]